MRRMNERTGRVLLACLLSSIMPLSAADNQTPQPTEIEQLKQMLADQQKQINELRQALAQQQASAATPTASPVIPAADPTPVSTFRNLGEVASTTGLVPRPKTLPAAMALPAIPLPQAAAPNPTGSAKNPCEADVDKVVPTFLRIGNVCVVPIGFMDFTPFWRDKNAASSMGSNFGGVPYNNSINGNLNEFHFSEQNSRLGFRVDGDWKGTHFIGYNEFDFNGTSGSTSLAVSNGAIVPRLRLFWADVRKGKVEFLAGQSWSMLTPNRTGLSALPGDLFYTQVIDINYVAGLTWTRQPGIARSHPPQRQGNFRLVRRTSRSVHRRVSRRLPDYSSERSFDADLNTTRWRPERHFGQLPGTAHLHPGLHREGRFRSDESLPLRSRRCREQLQDCQSVRALDASHHRGCRTPGRPQCRGPEKRPPDLVQLSQRW